MRIFTPKQPEHNRSTTYPEQAGKYLNANLFNTILATKTERKLPLHTKIGIFICGISLLVGGVYFASEESHACKGDSSIDIQKLWQLTNQERAKHGLKPVVLDPDLTQIARLKCDDMVNNDYFANTSPDGKAYADILREKNITYGFAGENLARGYTSAQDVSEAWILSPEHEANIVNQNYTKVGFWAYDAKNFQGNQSTTLVIEEFDSPSTPQ